MFIFYQKGVLFVKSPSLVGQNFLNDFLAYVVQGILGQLPLWHCIPVLLSAIGIGNNLRTVAVPRGLSTVPVPLGFYGVI